VNLMPFSERKETRVKSRVIVNGVDSTELDVKHGLSRCKWLEQFSRLREKYSVLALELVRCDRLKNQQGLLKALWSETCVVIILAGPMSLESGYCGRVRALAGARPGVVALGNVPRQELGALFRSVDVHILPSWTETTVPLEIIEVQNGEYVGEDDIERVEDVYGRTKSVEGETPQ